MPNLIEIQKDSYQWFLDEGLKHFEYNDGYDSNGKASNKGIVSIEYEPYTSFLSQMRQVNLAVHSLIDYYDTKSVQ